MKKFFMRKYLVDLLQIHFPLLDHLVVREPSAKRAELIRLAIEEYVVNHPNWDASAFTAQAKQYAASDKGLPEGADIEFWRDHRRILAKAGRSEALPHPNSLDIEVSAEDFDA